MESTPAQAHAELTAELPDLDGLYEVIYGSQRWPVLAAGISLNIFDHLSDPVTAGDVAQATGSHAGNTGLFLDALAALDLVQKKQGRYQNTPATEAFLVRERPTYLGDFLRDIAAGQNRPAEALAEMVRQGPPPPQAAPDGAETLWGDMAHHYVNYLRAGMARRYLDVLNDVAEMQPPLHLLDLGGGPGLTAIAMALAHPALQAVVVDLPPVAAVAREMIDRYDLGDRVAVIAGDYLNDDIGDGYDLVYAGFTLNYVRAELDTMLAKVEEAMCPGGIFMHAGEGLIDERTSPRDYVVGMLPYSLAGQDMSFDRGEVAESMRRVGFDVVRSLRLNWPPGPVDIDVARKPDTG